MRDVDIRQSLHLAVRALHGGEPNTLVLDELALCQGTARVDVAVVNGVIHGYEIKSEHDTLARLANQAEVYGRALDLVTIVTGVCHAERVERSVPRWWGVICAERVGSGVQLTQVREARDNPGLDPVAVAQLLWREEALAVLDEYGLAARIRSKPRRVLWQRLAASLTPDELGCAVRERLKHREGWRAPTARQPAPPR